MTNNINFADQRAFIQQLGEELFARITKLPKDIRFDDKERTGVQIVARELRTRNLVMVPVFEPSEAARFFAVEKSVRAECYVHPTSQDSECPEDTKYAGCISYSPNEAPQEFHVSVSGLKAEEDVAIAIIIMSKLMNIPIEKIMLDIVEVGKNVSGEDLGMLPDELFDDDHYLFAVLNEYK